MLENEKIIKENIKLPDNILSKTDEVKIEEPDNEIIKEEIKIEEPENIKVAESTFTKDQQKDINELLEADVSLEDAKSIVSGTYKEGDTKTIDYEGKSEYEGDKEFLAKDGIDLDLIIKTKPEALKKSEAVVVDDVGLEVADDYISAKMLYEVNGYRADKESEIKGSIRFDLGFGLDGAQFKENNIKNLLIKRITESGKYNNETLTKYLDKIEVKTVSLTYKGQEKNGLVYRIPKELGGTNMFAAVDSPKIGMADLSDAVADSGPIVASIIGGTFGSTLGPVGTVAGSAVSAGLSEMARLMYGYHKLGLQNDLYTPEEFFDVAFNASIKYAAIDAAATGVFLAGAKLILPTILGKSQLSTSTIKEFIETQGKTNTGLFKEVNKVKAMIKKEFNFTDAEVDNYFAVSVGKAILNSDQLAKKSSAAQRALLSDEVKRLENMAEYKALENKIILATTKVSEVGNKAADDIIKNIQNQVIGQAEYGIKQAELALLTNTKQVAALKSKFIDDLTVNYLDEFGVTMNTVYKNIQARLDILDDSINKTLLKNNDLFAFNLSKIIRKMSTESKSLQFSKGLFPSKALKIPKNASKVIKTKIINHNLIYQLGKELEESGIKVTGKKMDVISKGFKELSKKDVKIKDMVLINKTVKELIERNADKPLYKGQLIQLRKAIDANIYEAISTGTNKKLAAEWAERKNLLEFKKTSFWDNFTNEFGHSGTTVGTANLRQSSDMLFNSIINTTSKSIANAMKLGDLIKRGIVPNSTKLNIESTLYTNYLNKVIPDQATGKALMSHAEFFSKFGKNYKAILGNEKYKALYNTKQVLNALDKVTVEAANINAVVYKFLGIPNWSSLSNAGPGEIVEAILSKEFTKTQNLTKLLQALPASTVKQIREIYLSRMMKEVTDGTFTPGWVAKGLGGSSTTTINAFKMNAFLNSNRSALIQLYDPSFYTTMRAMADVLEMLQVPKNLARATHMSVKDATENAALFIDMIYGPLNHKRLILNRFARLLDKTKMNTDNIFLFTDYAMFTEAAKKNFLAGNYPAFIDKLPTKKRGVFIDKVVNLLNRVPTLGLYDLGQGAGLRKTFNLIPKKGNWTAPLKNPLVQKEYLEDQYSEMKGEDRMQGNADMFFPVDVTAKYAVKALMAVFKGLKKGKEWVGERISEASKEEKRDIKEEKFEKELAK
jgi:hypothetical protein